MRSPLAILGLFIACGGEPAPDPCVDRCDGATLIICLGGIGTAAFDCSGPDGCHVSPDVMACDLFDPRLGEECSAEQFSARLEWCTQSWPDVVARCQQVLGSVPRWDVASVCPDGSVCTMVDGAPSCYVDG